LVCKIFQAIPKNGGLEAGDVSPITLRFISHSTGFEDLLGYELQPVQSCRRCREMPVALKAGSDTQMTCALKGAFRDAGRGCLGVLPKCAAAKSALA
jgi:hypothetical protein